MANGEENKDNIDGSPVDPENTEKLYGSEDFEEPRRPGDKETVETELPDEVDDVDDNIFPSMD